MSYKYKKIPARAVAVIGMYPVYSENIYQGREPFSIVGVRKNEIELKGDFSGGTHNVSQTSWVSIDECFAISTVCDQQLKPGGCQVHNIYCCGGGSPIGRHTKYWESIVG